MQRRFRAATPAPHTPARLQCRACSRCVHRRPASRGRGNTLAPSAESSLRGSEDPGTGCWSRTGAPPDGQTRGPCGSVRCRPRRVRCTGTRRPPPRQASSCRRGPRWAEHLPADPRHPPRIRSAAARSAGPPSNATPIPIRSRTNAMSADHRSSNQCLCRRVVNGHTATKLPVNPSSSSIAAALVVSRRPRGISMTNGSVGSPSTSARCRYSDAIARSSPPRLTTRVISRREPSRDPRPIRTGAPERNATSPLRSRPWASMATSKRRSRREAKKSTASRASVPHRHRRSRRFHAPRCQTITSSRCGLWTMISAVRSSATQAMQASG